MALHDPAPKWSAAQRAEVLEAMAGCLVQDAARAYLAERFSDLPPGDTLTLAEVESLTHRWIDSGFSGTWLKRDLPPALLSMVEASVPALSRAARDYCMASGIFPVWDAGAVSAFATEVVNNKPTWESFRAMLHALPAREAAVRAASLVDRATFGRLPVEDVRFLCAALAGNDVQPGALEVQRLKVWIFLSEANAMKRMSSRIECGTTPLTIPAVQELDSEAYRNMLRHAVFGDKEYQRQAYRRFKQMERHCLPDHVAWHRDQFATMLCEVGAGLAKRESIGPCHYAIEKSVLSEHPAFTALHPSKQKLMLTAGYGTVEDSRSM